MATPFTSISVSDTVAANNITCNALSSNAINVNTTDLYVNSSLRCDNLVNNISNIQITSPSISVGTSASQSINCKATDTISLDTNSLRIRDITGAFTSLTINQPTAVITGTTITPAGAVCINKATNTSGYYLDVNGAIINNSTIKTTSTTASTSSTTGAIQCSGGAGIAGSIFTGGSVNATGSLITTNTGASISTSTGALVVGGGVGIAGAINIGGGCNVAGSSALSNSLSVTGQTVISNTTDSTSTTTGALLVGGGCGIGGNVNIGGAITATGALQAESISISNPTFGYISVNPSLGQPSLNTDVGFFSRVNGSSTVSGTSGRVVRNVITLTTLPAGVWRFDVTIWWSLTTGILNTSNSVLASVSNTSLFDPYTDTTYTRSSGRPFWDRDSATSFFWGGSHSFSVIDSSATAKNWYITMTGGNTTNSGGYVYNASCTFSRVA